MPWELTDFDDDEIRSLDSIAQELARRVQTDMDQTIPGWLEWSEETRVEFLDLISCELRVQSKMKATPFELK